MGSPWASGGSSTPSSSSVSKHMNRSHGLDTQLESDCMGWDTQMRASLNGIDKDFYSDSDDGDDSSSGSGSASGNSSQSSDCSDDE